MLFVQGLTPDEIKNLAKDEVDLPVTKEDLLEVRLDLIRRCK